MSQNRIDTALKRHARNFLILLEIDRSCRNVMLSLYAVARGEYVRPPDRSKGLNDGVALFEFVALVPVLRYL